MTERERSTGTTMIDTVIVWAARTVPSGAIL